MFKRAHNYNGSNLLKMGHDGSKTVATLFKLFVKLHADLRILTQLQLVGVGVDFVFALEEGRRKEGRKKK